MARILVTGGAGFIGSHVAAALAADGQEVAACDSFNDYYDVRLKRDRVASLLAPAGVRCVACDLAAPGAATVLLAAHAPIDCVVHLAGQAGVRDSIERPMAHVNANVVAFVELLEACRTAGVRRVIYASSSSVYGRRSSIPFGEGDPPEPPASIYAATKQADEAIAGIYASTHGMALLGLRFFTIYGPWGRPDMAYFSFARRIRAGQAIDLYGDGLLQRDFTYIDDAVEAMRRLVRRAQPDGLAEVLNIGQRQPVSVETFVAHLESALGLMAITRRVAAPPADVPITCADPARLNAAVGAWAWTPLGSGLVRFADWLREWEPAAD